MAHTGRQLALEMIQKFPGRDWIAELADRTSHTRDFIEWHLQEDIAVPDDVKRAAEDMLRPTVLDDGKPGNFA
ncbi:hypothetical protein DWF00_16620 [Bosea caraganae]|uniref:Uncharacterized protein n=1 Tax=Bosea caraganae TaxID=2763117 RepID=A0A370KYS3_9HYPH|nr:hypothetical protein [Bosea caraganae]RDJ20133.1 hypothetical protein DWE98_26225 [Bosea caraganae]RDJ24845.1 hypothetical protein DWF00_16620 [Bosea caraganae]